MLATVIVLAISAESRAASSSFVDCILNATVYRPLGRLEKFRPEVYEASDKIYERFKSPAEIVRELARRKNRGYAIPPEEIMAAVDRAFPNRSYSFKDQAAETKNLKFARYVMDFSSVKALDRGVKIKATRLQDIFYSSRVPSDLKELGEWAIDLSEAMGAVEGNIPSTWPWKSLPGNYSKDALENLLKNNKNRAYLIHDLKAIGAWTDEQSRDSLGRWPLWELLGRVFWPFYDPVKASAKDNIYAQAFLRDPSGEEARALLQRKLGFRLKSKWAIENIHRLLLLSAGVAGAIALPKDLQAISELDDKVKEKVKNVEGTLENIDLDRGNEAIKKRQQERLNQNVGNVPNQIEALDGLSQSEKEAAKSLISGL